MDKRGSPGALQMQGDEKQFASRLMPRGEARGDHTVRGTMRLLPAPWPVCAKVYCAHREAVSSAPAGGPFPTCRRNGKDA